METKYKENPQKMNEEMAKLYKETGYNPMSGCLPLLIQFPLIIAMFNLFNNYFEFRGAMFIPGWIPDLSVGDSIESKTSLSTSRNSSVIKIVERNPLLCSPATPAIKELPLWKITSIEFLYNSAIEVENYLIAGSRGWFVDKSIQVQKNVNADHEKILNREIIRLRLSLDAAKKLSELEHNSGKEIIIEFEKEK